MHEHLPTCVIYNPAAGRGRARRGIPELQASLGKDAELWPTLRAGHAVQLASQAVEQGFARILAVGGDGTVHEVANGILRSDRPDVVFSVWPLGSANDYAYTLGMSAFRQRRADRSALRTLAVDVGRVRSGERESYFVSSLGIGFNGMVTVEARKIRWLRGLPLYALGFLRAMSKHFIAPRMQIDFDGVVRTGPTLALTVNLAQREGGFPLTPDASLTDGLFDFMHATRLSRGHLLRFLPAMVRGRLPRNHPLLHLGRARRIEVNSDAPLCVHTDGEFFCVPEEGVRELTVEGVPARLLVEVWPEGLYGGKRQ